jgi:hypothetical protein
MSDWIAYRNPRVHTVAQYLLRDDSDVGNFNTGLRFFDGRPKPALDAYRMPIWVTRNARRTRVWGQVRPAAEGAPHQVQVQYAGAEGRRWRTLRTVTVTGPRVTFDEHVNEGVRARLVDAHEPGLYPLADGLDARAAEVLPAQHDAHGVDRMPRPPVRRLDLRHRRQALRRADGRRRAREQEGQ